MWSSAPDELRLGPRDIHVWRTALDQSTNNVPHFRSLLSSDELARADRYRFEKDCAHFVIARGVLRTLLGRYLESDPATVEFSYSQYGKPSLIEAIASGLHFNLAHSGAVALYAFTRIGEVGVDVEFMRPEFIGDDIARRFFSSAELRSLQALPDSARHQAFFNCWSRKEAVIKAKGLGLSLGLDQFDVTLAPGEPARLLRTGWNEAEAMAWSLSSIEVGGPYTAALAIQSLEWQARYFEFS